MRNNVVERILKVEDTADQIIENAELEAKKIVQQAEADASRLVREASEKAAREGADLVQKQESICKASIESYEQEKKRADAASLNLEPVLLDKVAERIIDIVTQTDIFED